MFNTDRPRVTLTYAQSLDGSIAARSGERLALSGTESMACTHQLRAAHDAILVGIGTVLSDDPRLDVRLVDGPSPRPIVLDSDLRCPAAARCLEANRRPIVATTDRASPILQRDLEAQGARFSPSPSAASMRLTSIWLPCSIVCMLSRSNRSWWKAARALADGIGGHKAGELAAELAVNVISHTVSQSDAFEPLNTLQVAIQAASQRIAAQARDNTQHLDMGTTCACAWIVGRRLYTASGGASRIYLLRGKTIRQLTTDHTWIQEAIGKGILKAEQARDHPNVHVIRRYLGSAKPPEPDLRLRMRRGESDTQAEGNQGFLLYPGDRLLLCSDGLTDEVSDEGIRVASLTPDLEFAAESLIELANSNGGSRQRCAARVFPS